MDTAFVFRGAISSPIPFTEELNLLTQDMMVGLELGASYIKPIRIHPRIISHSYVNDHIAVTHRLKMGAFQGARTQLPRYGHAHT